MLKRIFFLFVFVSLQLGIFVQPVLGASSCQEQEINWEPKIFLENTSDYTLTFTINNNNTFNILKDHGVRLLVDKGVAGLGGWFTNSINIQDKTFSIPLTGDLTKNGLHHANLEWVPTGTVEWTDFCSDIAYQVGIVVRCNIHQLSIPEKIPPNTPLTISFVGKANTDYQLKIGNPDILNIISTIANFPISLPVIGAQQLIAMEAAKKALTLASTLNTVRTDENGQARFISKEIGTTNGERLRLVLYDPNADIRNACYKDTLIDSKESTPVEVPEGTVQPAPVAPVVRSCPKEGEQFDPAKHLDSALCTKGGGESCEGKNDGRGPAMKTAIGCIHTSPVEFVKDFLKFIIAISGGLAFLMMLLGAFQMLTSAGNPDSLNAGRERLTSAVIGLLFVIFAILLMQIIGVGILDIPGFKP